MNKKITIFEDSSIDEIINQLSYVKEWGCKFFVAVPRLEIVN
jgi:hypothetical protein